MAIVLLPGCGESDRYMIAKGDNNVVYRTDRKTGETVMIRGTKMLPVVKEGEKMSPRKLTKEETKRIEGRAHVSSVSSSTFCCSLYNGNVNIRLTSVTIGLMHKEYGKDCPRAYKHICGIGEGRPLSALKFDLPIVRGEEAENHRYEWLVIDARGIDEE